MSKWSGYGTLTTYANNNRVSVYRGEFKNDHMHGNGELIDLVNNETFKGLWIDNRWEG